MLQIFCTPGAAFQLVNLKKLVCITAQNHAFLFKEAKTFQLSPLTFYLKRQRSAPGIHPALVAFGKGLFEVGCIMIGSHQVHLVMVIFVVDGVGG